VGTQPAQEARSAHSTGQGGDAHAGSLSGAGSRAGSGPDAGTGRGAMPEPIREPMPGPIRGRSGRGRGSGVVLEETNGRYASYGGGPFGRISEFRLTSPIRHACNFTVVI